MWQPIWSVVFVTDCPTPSSYVAARDGQYLIINGLVVSDNQSGIKCSFSTTEIRQIQSQLSIKLGHVVLGSQSGMDEIIQNSECFGDSTTPCYDLHLYSTRVWNWEVHKHDILYCFKRCQSVQKAATINYTNSFKTKWNTAVIVMLLHTIYVMGMVKTIPYIIRLLTHIGNLT